jgi:hypothetical protein
MAKLLDSLKTSSLLRQASHRRTQLYCIGTAKSGTHSMHELLRTHLRSAHEAESEEVIDMILANAAGRKDDSEVVDYLLRRDRRLSLELDSSHLNIFLLHKLVSLFPAAKFILTIRDPYSWLDSFINHQLTHTASRQWLALRDFRFRPDLYVHQPEEMILKNHGLYTIDGYLSYWGWHNRKAVSVVPEEQLLIVRTDHITERVEEIAAFAGVPSRRLKREKSHSFKAQRKFDLLDKVDRPFLEDKIAEHCGGLVARFFPEFRLPGRNESAQQREPLSLLQPSV